MSASHQWAVQEAIYAKLTGHAALTALLPNGAGDLYDHVPVDSPMPYCRFSLGSARRLDTKQDKGLEITFQVESYSNAPGSYEIRQIEKEIEAALDEAALTVSGYTVVYCRFETARLDVLEGGKTRRLSQMFKIIIE